MIIIIVVVVVVGLGVPCGCMRWKSKLEGKIGGALAPGSTMRNRQEWMVRTHPFGTPGSPQTA